MFQRSVPYCAYFHPHAGSLFGFGWGGMPDIRRINMRKIRDVLRLKLEARFSHDQVAGALQISKGVISKYLNLANTAGLDWHQIEALDETALHNRLLGTPQRARGFVQPDYGLVHDCGAKA